MSDTTRIARFERHIPYLGYTDLQPHGWIITEDSLYEDGAPFSDETGTAGPSELADPEWSDLEDALTRKREGKPIEDDWQSAYFSMYDDDGELYYRGHLVWPANEEPDEDTLIAPLDNFGTPNAGAVRITYRGHKEWEIG